MYHGQELMMYMNCQDQSDDKDVNKTLSSKIGINTTGLFTIRELACLGTFATFAVTNDSAPMHILSSCNIPVFGIFGPSNKNVHHAIGDKFRAISSEKSNVDIASFGVYQVWSELEQSKFVGLNFFIVSRAPSITSWS